jgi:hypothetical protein
MKKLLFLFVLDCVMFFPFSFAMDDDSRLEISSYSEEDLDYDYSSGDEFEGSQYYGSDFSDYLSEEDCDDEEQHDDKGHEVPKLSVTIPQRDYKSIIIKGRKWKKYGGFNKKLMSSIDNLLSNLQRVVSISMFDAMEIMGSVLRDICDHLQDDQHLLIEKIGNNEVQIILLTCERKKLLGGSLQYIGYIIRETLKLSKESSPEYGFKRWKLTQQMKKERNFCCKKKTGDHSNLNVILEHWRKKIESAPTFCSHCFVENNLQKVRLYSKDKRRGKYFGNYKHSLDIPSLGKYCRNLVFIFRASGTISSIKSV